MDEVSAIPARLRKALLVAVWVVPPAASFAQPQGASGAVSGVVLDASGAPVPGASVEVVNAALGVRRGATTSNNGVFGIGNLTPGRGYTVTISKSGFAEWEASRMEILLGQDAFLNAKL